MSITANVSMYNFTAMNQDFIVLDTPGLSDTRGDDEITDDTIKNQIELAILQIGSIAKNTINAFLIFESCEEKMARINTTLRELRDMFGKEYAQTSICVLTGCSNTEKMKIINRRS